MADPVFLGLDFQTFLFVLMYLVLLPFVIIGVVKLMMVVAAAMKVRRGYIRVDKLLANDQLSRFWALPQGGKITFPAKNPAGVRDKTTMPVKLSKGWVWRDGNIPFIKLDKNNDQIPWEVNVVNEVPKEIIDEMTDTAYTAGLLLGSNFQNDIRKMMMFMLVVVVLVAISIFLNYYLWSNIHVVTQSVDANAIAQAVAAAQPRVV